MNLFKFLSKKSNKKTLKDRLTNCIVCAKEIENKEENKCQ